MLTVAALGFAAFVFVSYGKGKPVKFLSDETDTVTFGATEEEKKQYLDKEITETYENLAEPYSEYIYTIPGDIKIDCAEGGSDGEITDYYYQVNNFTSFEYEDFSCREIFKDAIEISKYNGTEKNVVIPASINGKTVRYIGEGAFAEGELTSDEKISSHEIESITIPDSVLYIGDSAFYSCEKLKDIVFPKKLVYIGQYAFAHCESIISLNIPACEVFGEESFGGCGSLTSLTLPEDTVLLLRGAFCSCPIKELSLNEKLEFINCAFEDTDVENVTIPSGVKVIFCGFSNCKKLEKITFEEGDTPLYSVYDFVSECTALREIHFPARLVELDTISESCLKMIRLSDIYFAKADIDGIGESDLNVTGIKRIHAPSGGNIEDYCRYRLRMIFTPTDES